VPSLVPVPAPAHAPVIFFPSWWRLGFHNALRHPFFTNSDGLGRKGFGERMLARGWGGRHEVYKGPDDGGGE